MQINVQNIPEGLEEGLWRLKIGGVKEQSRNGPVIAAPEPVHISIQRPWERVLTDPVRNANPFFHLAEFIWMMSGSNDVRFIEHYNARMREYADFGTDVHHGAYGHRWRKHFGLDQIQQCRRILHEGGGSRRAYIAMWDPRTDLEPHNDLPCNVGIGLRILYGVRLDFTLFNRSNDLVWGCLGANAVHMSYLHELLARSLGLKQGTYHVCSNNLHVYPEVKVVSDLLYPSVAVEDAYRSRRNQMSVVPVLAEGEALEEFLMDAENYIAGSSAIHCQWFHKVFLPAMRSFEGRKLVPEFVDCDWRIACGEWIERRVKHS